AAAVSRDIDGVLAGDGYEHGVNGYVVRRHRERHAALDFDGSQGVAVEAVVQESEFVSLERRCGHGDHGVFGHRPGRADGHGTLAGHICADGVCIRDLLEGGGNDDVTTRHLEAVSIGN